MPSPLKLEGRQLRSFQRRLLAWFRRNRRGLPWRTPRAASNPYPIWISEIMLQQTRVAAVLPYYRGFLRRFPSVRALARARMEEVLRHWAGLGYYSRARNLHRAARMIVNQYRGRFPNDLSRALALPGIGRYTANAILSMAHGAPLAVLDGNVERVLARLDAPGHSHGHERVEPRTARRRQQLQSRAQQLLSSAHPGDWNQAMMELGATVCIPRAPRCAICPVSRWCRAAALGIAEVVPRIRPTPTPVKMRIAAAVFVDPAGRTLLVRPQGKLPRLFSGMWQFPAVEVTRDGAGALSKHLREEMRRPSDRQACLPHTLWSMLPEVHHTVTFREITLAPFLVRVPRLPEITRARTVLLSGLAQTRRPAAAGVAISNATRKIAHAAARAIQ